MTEQRPRDAIPASSDPPDEQPGEFKLRVSREKLDQEAAVQAAHRASKEKERTNQASRAERIPDAGRPGLDQMVVIFGSALALGSVFVLPLLYAAGTLGFAFLLVGQKTSGGWRILAFAAALCSAAAVLIVLVVPSGHERDEGLNTEAARAKARLEILDRVNALRIQHHVKPLHYDPRLSIVAQQRADYGAAAHSGYATDQTAGELPSQETNMWLEMAGVACSWQRLFELEEDPGERSKGPSPEIGFIEDGAHVGSERRPFLSPDFFSLGVGIEPLPNGDVSIVLDFTGRPKPGVPWLDGMPNLLGEVAGQDVPECN